MAIKICIDAGHGGKDPGAISEGFREKDIVLNVALSLGKKLENLGFSVIFTRNSDIYQTVNEKAKIGNKSNADLFISLHCNSVSNKSANGVECLVYGNNGINEVLAGDICNNIAKDFGIKNRGVKIRPDLAVLRDTYMTSIIVELAFISNDIERNLLISKQNEFAKSIANTIVSYFNFEDDENSHYEEKRYNSLESVPLWARNSVEKLINKGKFADINNLDLSYDMVRLIVLLEN